jgi:putative PTS system IIBC component
MFLKILYFVIIIFMMFARLKNVCEKNEKYETIGDVLQILMLGLGIYYLISIKVIFQIVLLLIISVFLKEIINFITKKIFFKEKEAEENEKCKDCNSYEKWEK